MKHERTTTVVPGPLVDQPDPWVSRPSISYRERLAGGCVGLGGVGNLASSVVSGVVSIGRAMGLGAADGVMGAFGFRRRHLHEQQIGQVGPMKRYIRDQ
jgi:hypothetical protein